MTQRSIEWRQNGEQGLKASLMRESGNAVFLGHRGSSIQVWAGGIEKIRHPKYLWAVYQGLGESNGEKSEIRNQTSEIRNN